MKKAVALLIILISLAGCRSATKLKPDENKTSPHYWGSFSPVEGTTKGIVMPKYKIDNRVGLCFAIYQNFGFVRVPCGRVEDHLEK